MTADAGHKSEGNGGAKRSEARAARNARSKAHINLAKALASVFTAGVYTKSSQRTQIVLADMVTWCLAEYYRESA
jgi:hypothetical protein